MVSTGSFITIGSSEYSIPDTLIIHPGEIWDEQEEVYRIALGKPDMTPEDEALYKPLFMCLDKYLIGDEGFISDIVFRTGDTRLTFKLAYVSKMIQPFGVFYDIEAALDEIKIEGITKLAN